MLRLLNIEWTKIKAYRPLWVLAIIYMILSPGIVIFIHTLEIPIFNLDPDIIYEFPMGWNVTAWLAGWFQIFLGILLLMLVTNEFNFRTAKQNVIDGLSRQEYFLSKFYLVLVISLFATLWMVATATFANFTYTGGGGDYFDGFKYVPFFFFQTVGYLSIAVLVGVLLRSSGYAIIIFLAILIGEAILRGVFMELEWHTIRLYSPIGVVSNLTPIPLLDKFLAEEPELALTVQERLIGGMTYLGLYWCLIYYNLTKRAL